MISFQFFTKYSVHHPPLAGTSFKFKALTLFEIRHLQNLSLVFERAVILQGEIIQ